MAKRLDFKKRKTYAPLYNFFADDNACKLILTQNNMSGDDAAVLCYVANSLYNDGPLSVVAVDDTVDATNKAIDEFITAELDKNFNPEVNYIRIMVLDMANIDLDHIISLSTEDHRIVTTFIDSTTVEASRTRYKDRDKWTMLRRPVILPNGITVRGECVDDYHTYNELTRELVAFIDAFTTNHMAPDAYLNTIKAATKFVNNGICSMTTDFGKLWVNETKLLEGGYDSLPLWTVIKNSVIHFLFYIWACENGKRTEYITTMTDRILGGKVFADKKLAKELRKVFTATEDDDQDVLKQKAEFIEQYKTRVPDEFEVMLETALQDTFGAFKKTYETLMKSMVCISKKSTAFAELNGLNFYPNIPAIVMYTGSNTDVLPYEDVAVDYIFKRHVAEVPVICDQRRYTPTRSRVIPLAKDADDTTIYDTANIALLIKRDPSNNTVRVWCRDTDVMFVKAIREMTGDNDSTIKDINGSPCYRSGRYNGGIFDLSDPFGKKAEEKRKRAEARKGKGKKNTPKR
ncbi:MAG: hypothetical protein NC114_09935 [Ruminococcus flavefaciens]|nr:hypothetical protein [Ruminococcus flavefaciens]